MQKAWEPAAASARMRAMTKTPLPASAAEHSPYLRGTLTFDCADETATATLAATVARFAVAGDLIRLQGDLGAGKSTFVRYVLNALGHTGEVPSPTYTLVQFYATARINVAHLDCYRLESPEALDGLGLEAYRTDGLILAEWPDKGGALVSAGQPDYLSYHINNPDNGGTLDITFAPGATPQGRTIALTASPSWQRRFGLMFGFVRRPVSEARRAAFLDSLNLGPYRMDALPGDWSGRSYARVHLADGTTRMLMDSPPPWEGTEDFKNVAAFYRSIGLHAPEVFAQDAVEGYLLTEDFGSVRLLDLVEKGQDTAPWYAVAVDALAAMHSGGAMPAARRYAPRDWWVETARWIDWYFPMAAGRTATLEERAHIRQLWAPLYPLMMDGPLATLPWDYQATNLMILDAQPDLDAMGLIDFQDARTAPVAQDLAILLRDIRRDRDDALETAMLDHAARRLGYDRATLQTAVEIANLHHCVRIIGGLARSCLRDGKTAGAERFLARTWDVARQSYACPELKAIVDFIQPYEAPGMAALARMAGNQGSAAA